MPDALSRVTIRVSTEADVPTMLEIYSHHIQHGLGPFDIEPLHPDELKRRRKAMLAGCRQMVAVVDGANTPSLRLHEAFGFVRAGVLRSVGFRFGRWTDSVFLQRSLGRADTEPPDDARGGTVQAGD